MKILKNIYWTLALQFTIYIVQFVCIPFIYMPRPSNQDASTFILCTTTIVIAFVGFYFFADKIRYWIFSIPFYPLFIKIYHPTDIYGIGYDGFLFSFNENVLIGILTAVVFLMQLAVYMIAKLIKKYN